MDPTDQSDRPPEYQTRVVDRVTWTVRSDMTHLFEGPQAVNWTTSRSAESSRTVRTGAWSISSEPVRVVYRRPDSTSRCTTTRD